ncbi:fusaric acid resistance protein [Burkholderia pseudomallei MSHR338]|uniref:FUSC family protein n=1 Tax=Burkholderia pseudomallei TaxID=28450 RepID=UPI0001A42327|nr:FUSC family protein [Burkholderia pseudomallei]AIP06016.1 fusaric acid resistance family protein [Burkholderia pseudomallei]EEP49803.1 fusaric acid resistance domain protein [Burkholderia pseudomallei MSHR346]EQA87387.1 fusaric acid resistance protein [Burkholderia pseudomallei MSHR338]OMW28199.1 fusaric acid resistance protein [Burkholderia pseudomallei]ONA25252.1 fusaric acid resistance protein [Burkholderia pseudomallei]
MKHEPALQRFLIDPHRWQERLRSAGRLARDWAGRDGLVWLHLAKTVAAALLAMGIAMLLDLSQPRIAMTTVFVLMQPMSGMVLAKSFYRVVGTGVGLVAALALGGLFAQQPELYMAGITLWVAGCIAAAVRNRHFRWYGYVLAGYTAALIGLPAVMAPNTLFLSALTRAAEVAVGIFCSGAVSALVLPLSSSDALMRTLSARHADFVAFAASTTAGAVERGEFERRFADFVDGIVGFEATRAFATFEDPYIRARSRRLARLNSEFMNACARLHAFHQLLRRLRANHAAEVLTAIAPHVDALSGVLYALRADLARPRARSAPSPSPSPALVALSAYLAALPKRARASRRGLETLAPAGVLERSVTRYAVKTNRYFVGFTFLRTLVAMGAMSAFWIASEWSSGSLAVIGTAIACALSSTAPRASRFVAQMAAGAALATLTGYLYVCRVYPNIDGFPLLCAALAPVLAAGAYLATRPGKSGYGIGFVVFFCLLAGPDNVIVYAPDVLINNGLALVVSMLAASIAFAVVFPAEMPWLTGRIARDLRRQIALACDGPLQGLDQRFQSSSHDLMSQLRNLLMKRSRRHRDALRWMLATLEIGHAVIDLRREMQAFTAAQPAQALRWRALIDAVREALPRLFETPDAHRLARALKSVNLAIRAVRHTQHLWYAVPDERRRMQRIVSCLHFIRSALIDQDAPFNRGSRARERVRARRM